MNPYFYIKKIIRDDGQVLEFDQNEIYLDQDNTLLVRPDIETTAVEYTEADGGEMVAQRLTAGEQPINGLIIPKTTPYWTLRNRLTSFFQRSHTFSIVYEKKSGEQFVQGEKFKTATAWIEENLQAPVQPKEDYTRFSVTLRLGSANYEEYTEDAEGKETFAHNVLIGLISAASGGQVWDSVGQVWDSVGSVWETGDGGLVDLSVESAVGVYPTWTVTGEAVNPTIRNNTTDTQAEYSGTVAEGQKLVVDFTTGTATLDGFNVTRNLSGEFKLAPGQNAIGFEIDSGTATASTLSWNNIIQ